MPAQTKRIPLIQTEYSSPGPQHRLSDAL